MSRIGIALLLFAATFCLSIGGCVSAPTFVWLILGDPDNPMGYDDARWRQLPAPPAPIERIVAVDYFTVYVRTAEGRIFGCYRESRLDTRCWFERSHAPKDADDWSGAGFFPTPPPGLLVVQEYHIDYHEGRDSRSAFSYVLDGDGRVWQWGYATFAYTGGPEVWRISLLATVGGLVSGLLLPSLLTLLLWSVLKVREIIRRTNPTSAGHEDNSSMR